MQGLLKKSSRSASVNAIVNLHSVPGRSLVQNYRKLVLGGKRENWVIKHGYDMFAINYHI